MKYVCAALIVVVLMLGWFCYGVSSKLTDTKALLATANAVNEENAESFARLERSVKITNDVMAEWNADRTTLQEIRATTRKAIREAMQNEEFKTWSSGAVPDDAWRVLRQAAGEEGIQRQSATRSSDAGLSGNGHSGKRE